ncbi:SMY2 [[Candida] subhashii]|uniref:SMY2 n=1 Tax=[Candida] subhashii TaxID=561895 RepID=A0A8J5QIQ7_9ASCO|nr:SMY2 [[Candida] subhashii]KAG7661717.1 SMY2 [[Candida] subhashii]
MYSRTRKSQSSDTNGNFESHDSNPTGNSTTTASYTPIPTIPMNKGGKRYTMNEVFQVWYDNKDQILNPATEIPIKASEGYKLTKPSQIYHLELQPTNLKDDFGSQNELREETTQINDSLDKLSIGDEEGVATSIASATGVTGGTTGATSSTSGPPPGIGQPSDHGQHSISPAPLVTSDKIKWHYIDPMGNEQGPFNGDMMQEWLTGGYLNLDLKIRRKEETTFKTLKDLCDGLQNYIQPFKVPLPDLTVAPPPPPPAPAPAPAPVSAAPDTNQFFSPHKLHENPQLPAQSQFHQFLSSAEAQTSNLGSLRLSGLGGPQSNLFGNDFMKSDPFAQPLTPQSATFSQPGGHFGLDAFNPHHPVHHNLGFSNPLQHPGMPSLLHHQQQVPQPSMARVNSGWGLEPTSANLMGNVSSNPATPVPVNPILTNTTQINQSTAAPISPWISGGVQSSSRVSSPFAPSSTINSSNNNLSGSENVSPAIPSTASSKEALPAVASEDSVLHDIHSSVVTDILGEEEVPQKQQQQPVQTPKQKKTKQRKQSIPEPEPVEHIEPVHEEVIAQPEPEQEQEEEEEDEEPIKHAVDLKPAVPQELAPWATKQDIKKPAMTLKEIQELEAKKLKEQRKIEAQIRSEQGAKAWAEEPLSSPSEKSIPSLPATWASTTSAPVVTKTLAEIQKEEAEAKARAAAKAGVSSGGVPIQKTSFASAIAGSTPRDDGPAWTTVTSKKLAPAKKPTTASMLASSAAPTKVTPQLLRSVSAAKPVQSTVNATAVREDFLVWARSNMTNLYPSVSKNDLLDIFITLPANSSDSAQLISETIYSSSATMDGRRFAQEFLKRRQKVDQTIGGANDLVAWSAAVISSADKVQTVDEDGWTSTVKSKKKGKKF